MYCDQTAGWMRGTVSSGRAEDRQVGPAEMWAASSSFVYAGDDVVAMRNVTAPCSNHQGIISTTR